MILGDLWLFCTCGLGQFESWPASSDCRLRRAQTFKAVPIFSSHIVQFLQIPMVMNPIQKVQEPQSAGKRIAKVSHTFSFECWLKLDETSR